MKPARVIITVVEVGSERVARRAAVDSRSAVVQPEGRLAHARSDGRRPQLDRHGIHLARSEAVPVDGR